jgi:type IV secretion system protein VirB10
MRLRASLAAAAIVAFASALLFAIDADRDFSGRWILDPQSSHAGGLPSVPEEFLAVHQDEQAFTCTVTEQHAESTWAFTADGKESQYSLGHERRKTIGKWEGSDLLINTLVTGPPDYTIMDRWHLSADHAELTIERQVVTKAGEADGTIVYRREGQTQLTVRNQPPAPPASRANAPAAKQFTVNMGTHIPLTLVNALNTKQSKEGDGVYLETAFPVFADGRVAIPRGSYVQGTITKAQPGGKVKGKSELYIRFDSLTLPNGVTRDFRARVDAAENGKVDPKEGTITGDGRGGAHETGTMVHDTGMGASIGSLGGMATGHMGMGVGMGAAAGGVAGLASVIANRNAGVVLPRGSSMEMVLDRDLVYSAEELRF